MVIQGPFTFTERKLHFVYPTEYIFVLSALTCTFTFYFFLPKQTISSSKYTNFANGYVNILTIIHPGMESKIK